MINSKILGNKEKRCESYLDSLRQLLDRILSKYIFVPREDIETLRIEMIDIREQWIESKSMTKNLKLQLDVATSDIQTIRFELKESEKRTKQLEKKLDIAATDLYSNETIFRVFDWLKYGSMMSLKRFQDIGCLFDEQYKNPLLGLWLLRHIIQTTTHQIDRDCATCFLSLKILQGNCISYDTAESDTRENRVKNFSDPRNADKFMMNVSTQSVQDFYKYHRDKFLSEFPLDAYSKKARSYIRKHCIQREEQ